MNRFLLGVLVILPNMSCSNVSLATVRIATFNSSMEATNYRQQAEEATGKELSKILESGVYPQIRNIAEIVQHVRPNIILINEFDYTLGSVEDIKQFRANYLNVSQNGAAPIDFLYTYAAPVNTGVDSGLDLDGDGVASGVKADAFGFGLFPGHYGMVILSQYPIDVDEIRTFQHFLWKDMPDSLLPTISNQKGESYYSAEAQNILRLSSKSHWDIPIKVNGHALHILASHPTPPVFDGPEDRNGKRNHDEIRFWTDYISGEDKSAYIYDDKGKYGGLSGTHFVVAGDLNASVDEGDAYKAGIKGLLAHRLVNDSFEPVSQGGAQHTPTSSFAQGHTAAWGMRADYVLPSTSLKVLDSGVFWPIQTDALHRLVKDRSVSSDHRLVWVDIVVGQ